MAFTCKSKVLELTMKNINEDKKHLILVIPKISCHFIYRITATAPKNATGTASTSKQYRKY